MSPRATQPWPARMSASRAITDFTTLTLGNNAAGDYTLTGATGSVDISALAVHLTGSRIYDGTNTASFSILTVANAAVGDTVDVASGNATLASKDVGSRAITDFTTLTLGNNAAGDYTLTGATGSVDISALAVHLTGSRIYDGTNTASFSILTVANAAVGDTVDVASGNATLASKDVGSRAITDFTTLTLGNNAAGDYTLTGATGSVDISALAVHLTGSRIYDGTNTASFSILTVANAAVGDTVDVASGNATLASKDVGSRAITDFTTLTLGNNAAGDYTLTGATGSVDISALAVHLTGSRIYDGTNTASFSILTVANAAVGDTVDVASGNATLASKDVGLRAITDFTTLTLGNNAAGDYTLTGATGSVDISALAVHLTGSRIYDGTNTASFSILTVANAAVGDTVDVASGNATLASKDVGLRAITDFTTLTLGNNAPGDYTLTGATGGVNIGAASLSVTAQTDSREYNGTNSSSGVPVLTGALHDPIGTAATQAFDNKNVGTGKTLTASGLVVNDGNGGLDYTITYFTNTSGVITQAALTITAVTNTKIFDGTTSAAAIPNVSGLKGTDTVTNRSETYDTPDVGPGKTLSVATYTVNDGNSGNNYTVETVADHTGIIVVSPITHLVLHSRHRPAPRPARPCPRSR